MLSADCFHGSRPSGRAALCLPVLSERGQLITRLETPNNRKTDQRAANADLHGLRPPFRLVPKLETGKLAFDFYEARFEAVPADKGAAGSHESHICVTNDIEPAEENRRSAVRQLSYPSASYNSCHGTNG